jgi:hypothetical protein
MIPRGFAVVVLTALPLACFGCGNSNAIKVSGKLLRGGQPYVPPAGQRVVVTLYVIDAKDASGKALPAQEPFQSYYDPKDGTFVVPGPDGYGVPPGKYRISIFQGLTREGESKARSEHQRRPRDVPRIDRETDFFKGVFGPSTSPIVREVNEGAELIVDLDKETPAGNQAQTEKGKKVQQQHGD